MCWAKGHQNQPKYLGNPCKCHPLFPLFICFYNSFTVQFPKASVLAQATWAALPIGIFLPGSVWTSAGREPSSLRGMPTGDAVSDTGLTPFVMQWLSAKIVGFIWNVAGFSLVVDKTYWTKSSDRYFIPITGRQDSQLVRCTFLANQYLEMMFLDCRTLEENTYLHDESGRSQQSQTWSKTNSPQDFLTILNCRSWFRLYLCWSRKFSK